MHVQDPYFHSFRDYTGLGPVIDYQPSVRPGGMYTLNGRQVFVVTKG
jgi:hypothetical protein